MSTQEVPIAVAYGDGIGPEIMESTLKILHAAKAPISIHTVEIGEKVYLNGISTGIEPKTWDVIRSCRAFLKAPITTPQGGGFKSLNVTIRTTLGLYANIRPCPAYAPFIDTKHPDMNVVIIRENEEDLYSGIEYRLTPQAFESLKLISRPGSEKIIRFAFEYAKQNNRKKVSCFTKDNIMKISDGLFHKVFNEIAMEYPEIESEHWIIDIGAAKLADTPEDFDVIVLANLYGDILSDVAAQICGSIGMVGTSNIGIHGAMFEAIHGSAPDIAGKNIANPSALLLAAVQMLVYLDLNETAAYIHNAWLKTIEDGIHTGDIYHPKTSLQKVGTQEFTNAVIQRLGKGPAHFKEVFYHRAKKSFFNHHAMKQQPTVRELVGIDIFIYSELGQEAFIKKMLNINIDGFTIDLISNRGVRIYPNGQPETFCIDQYRVRFLLKEKEVPFTQAHLIHILKLLDKNKIDIVKVVNLYQFDGAPGYSQAKG
ncbi:MAG: NADP-dependent isocitrate dehydrogenase [Chlamydiales bacterium]|nr:NADP-dependent isocitrate dehydrogenase [Chlamydiales bacterium]